VEAPERKKPPSSDQSDDRRALNVELVELALHEAAGSLNGSHEKATTTAASYWYSSGAAAGRSSWIYRGLDPYNI